MFAKAREKARQSSCLSNVKQLALTWLQYSQDYDERLPPQYWNNRYWALIVRPYAKNDQMFICPSETGYNATTGVGYYGGNTYGLQYSPLGVAASTNNGGVALAQVDSPSMIMMLGDNRGVTAGICYPYDDLTPRNGYGVPADRHNEGGNWAYVDGHTKWVKPTSVINLGTGRSAVWNF